MKLHFIPYILAFLTFTSINGDLLAEESTKAVIEASKTEGFKLSDVAKQTIGLGTQQIEASSEVLLPKQAIVHSMDQTAVYRVRKGWFKFIPVELRGELGPQVKVYSTELKSGDQVAVKGVALLRVSEMEAFNGGGE